MLRIKKLENQRLRIKSYESKVNKSRDASKGELSMVKMRTKVQNNKYSNDMDFKIGPVPWAIFTTARAEWLFLTTWNVPSRGPTVFPMSQQSLLNSRFSPPTPNSRFSIPNPQPVTLHSQLPIPNSQFQISNSSSRLRILSFQFSTPNCQFTKPKYQSVLLIPNPLFSAPTTKFPNQINSRPPIYNSSNPIPKAQHSTPNSKFSVPNVPTLTSQLSILTSSSQLEH